MWIHTPASGVAGLQEKDRDVGIGKDAVRPVKNSTSPLSSSSKTDKIDVLEPLPDDTIAQGIDARARFWIDRCDGGWQFTELLRVWRPQMYEIPEPIPTYRFGFSFRRMCISTQASSGPNHLLSQ